MSQHFLFRSDHRTYYVDFSAEALLSDPAYEIQPASHWRLRLNDPHLIQQYQTLLHEQLQLHKVLEKVGKLHQHAVKHTWTEEHTEDYQKLDVIITEAMRHAENKTGRQYSTKYEWSPTLQRAVYAHRFWKLKLQQHRHKTFPSSRLEYYRTAANLPVTDGILMEQEIIRSVQSDCSDLKAFQSRHRELQA